MARTRSAAAALLAAVAFPSFWRSAAETGLAGKALRVPKQLDCSDRPEWDGFRREATAHVARGWVSEGAEAEALEASAQGLFNRWRGFVCTEPCQTSEDFAWGFVEALGDTCHDSAHFDRYVKVHYFTNRGVKYGGASSEDKYGFCLYGFVTALVVLGQFEFSRSVGRAQRFLFLALQLLGDFFVFDWLESSGWPVRLLDVNINLLLVTTSFQVVAPGAADALSRHPGERGGGRLRDLQRWEGTDEALKPSAAVDTPGAEVVVWQICQHTSVAGEAKTMLERFEGSVGVRVRFIGNSIGGNVCNNYGLCAEKAVQRELEAHLESYRRGEPFASVSRRFVAAFRHRVVAADVLMCSQPPGWCRFLLAFGDKPVWMYVGLPLVWDVNEEDRLPWLREVAAMAQDPQHIVTANSVFLARELHWQVGARPPVLRMLGLHTGAVHTAARSEAVLVSRFGTSAALSECVFARFLNTNPWYPLRFTQLEALLFEEHRSEAGEAAAGSFFNGVKQWGQYIREIKTPGMPYGKMAEHRAAVLFPYDAIIFLFHEFYSMQVPVFVPRDLWRWMYGPLTLPSMGLQLPPNRSAPDDDAQDGRLPRPPYTPFFAEPRRPVDLEMASYWTALTDWALLPHVQYFRGVPDLFTRLLDGPELRRTTALMKTFNEDQLVTLVDGWRRVASRLAHAAGAARARR